MNDNNRKDLDLLLVEDSEDDADLLVHELKRGGYRLDHRRVDTPEALRSALDQHPWDLVIADYTMPRLSGTQALAMVRSHTADVPFIFVSGTVGEETAVAALKAGAQDYMVKGNTGRLLPAIERELRDARARTENARLEAERRALEDRYRQVLTIATDGIIVANEKSEVSIFNRGAERMFGYGSDAMIGHSLDLLWPPRLVAANRTRIVEALASPERAGSTDGELIAQRSDGEEFPVEATFTTLSENGRTALTMIVRDIAERKRAEKKLRQLSRALEQSANLVIVADANGSVEYVNPRFFEATGYTAEEVIGRKPFFWQTGAHGAGINEEVWSTVLSGQDWRGEFDNMRKEGRPIAVSATISPVTGENGAITQIIAIEEDISRRKEIEAQLQQAQKMEAVGQLTGGIAHDFNNLLAIIIGNLDLLTGRLKGDQEAHAGIQLALAASLRGADLTRQLLAFARQQPLSPRTFDMNNLVDELVSMLRRILGDKVTISTNLSNGLWPVEADPAQVETALTNLAINSRDAMQSGGSLVVATSNRHFDPVNGGASDVTPGDYVALSVTDTGTGISPEDLKRVCEPFYTTRAPGKGTGLGLSMVYGFAKQSGGHLRIESAVGSGTIVTLFLPRSKNAAVLVSPDAEAAVKPGNATILVVEDNPHVQDVVVRQLVDLGYEVKAVDDALAALSALRESSAIDLLFSDVQLPGGITGAALVREARKLRPGLRVLLTSGMPDPSSYADALDEGVAFIAKPYRRVELAKKVGLVLTEAA